MGVLASKNGIPLMVMEMAAVCAIGVVVAVWFALRKRAAATSEDGPAQD